MVTRRSSKDITWYDLQTPQGRKYRASAYYDPRADEIVYKKGRQRVSEADLLGWIDETEAYYNAKRQARITANRRKGAKKQAKTRKQNFVSTRVVRGPAITSDDYYKRSSIRELPRTNNEGRGSRINTSKYAGRGARRGDYESTYNGVHYSSTAGSGRY